MIRRDLRRCLIVGTAILRSRCRVMLGEQARRHFHHFPSLNRDQNPGVNGRDSLGIDPCFRFQRDCFRIAS